MLMTNNINELHEEVSLVKARISVMEKVLQRMEQLLETCDTRLDELEKWHKVLIIITSLLAFLVPFTVPLGMYTLRSYIKDTIEVEIGGDDLSQPHQ